MRVLPIVVAQVAAVPGDTDATWSEYETEVRELCATLPNTRLILHPELVLSAPSPRGSNRDPEQGSRLEKVPGPLTDRLSHLASELDVWLIPGSIYETDDHGAVYNTAVAISPDGKIAAHYRKCFPWRPYEQTTPGKDFVVFDIPGVGRAGLMVCYDGWFPEVARHLAWMGAEVIFQPSATDTSDREQELALARATAIVNQVFVVNVNTAAPLGVGRSIIVDPEGRVLQVAGEARQFLSEVIDLDVVTRVRQFGAVGLNRMWTQITDGEGPPLPMYQGSFQRDPTRIRQTKEDAG